MAPRTSSRTRSTPTASSSTASATQPDAIAVLKADHRRVSDLFDAFEQLGDRAHVTRRNTVAAIIEELSRHAGIEENVFYPAVRERLTDASILEAFEEHHVVEVLLHELETMDPAAERYAAKVTVLREIVDHHVDEEESELFVMVREAFSRAELRDLGAQLEAARPGAPTRPHPSAPDEPPASIVATVLSAPLDAVAGLTTRAGEAVRSAVG